MPTLLLPDPAGKWPGIHYKGLAEKHTKSLSVLHLTQDRGVEWRLQAVEVLDKRMNNLFSFPLNITLKEPSESNLKEQGILQRVFLRL